MYRRVVLGVWTVVFAAALGSLSAAATVKTGPEGIVCLTTNPTSLTSLAADAGWTNANVKGFLIRLPWSTVEPSQNVYDFSIFTEAVTLAAKYHKFVGLSVDAGASSPSWVYTAGAVKFSFTPANGGPVATMPEPWDPVFLALWDNLIVSMGDAFDGNAGVAYIVMTGPGRDYETDFVSAPADVSKFESAGDEPLWQAAALQIAETYVASFPHTHLIYAMSPPTPDTSGATTIATVVGALFAEYPQQFGVACASLAPTTAATVPSVGLIQSQSSHSTVGFQMFAQAPVMAKSEGKHVSARTVLSESLTNAVLFKAHYVEVYSTDCSTSTQQTNLLTADTGLTAISVASSSP